jgi:hypothetical protein
MKNGIFVKQFFPKKTVEKNTVLAIFKSIYGIPVFSSAEGHTQELPKTPKNTKRKTRTKIQNSTQKHSERTKKS